MKSRLFLFLILLFSSCSNLSDYSPSTNPTLQRLPASNIEDISYYLLIDKFKYYLNEYAMALDEKIPDSIISHLRDLKAEEILQMGIDNNDLEDAHNYDKIIWNILERHNLTEGLKPEQLKWNYNFFKTKLNDAFVLSKSKLDLNDSPLDTLLSDSVNGGISVTPTNIDANDMTLDTGHYISNRTTRAVFWEANQNNRPIEFHLGDSREFLKKLKDNNGKVLYEIKTFAKNYNKIYIVQYPNEVGYRYAITNIGGEDRLNHLIHQISLSNISNQGPKLPVLVKDDIKKFHALKEQEHTLQLNLLPKADRVIIGQKESIDNKFNLFWKVKALKVLYDHDPQTFSKKIDAFPNKEKYFSLTNSSYDLLFKNKKIIEDVYLLFEDNLKENERMLPPKFKIYNYDNFTIEMCDYIFEAHDGNKIRWRVVSNVWGDEIVPIAKALKNTGHTRISYIGTAGAFANKNYKVGDLVIPDRVRDNSVVLSVKKPSMAIEGGKYGGVVEHVGSPFEESKEWLKKAQEQSDFVEVETSYLRKIFNGPNDNLEIYLLISDILGSQDETLAHATSSKRKNAQNKLLAKIFERDSRAIPLPLRETSVGPENAVKSKIFRILKNKNPAYQYYVLAHFIDRNEVQEEEIIDFTKKHPPFTDNYLLERLVKIGEIINEIKKKTIADGSFAIAFSSSLIDGTWNPKEEKLQIIIKAKNAETDKAVQKVLKENAHLLASIKSYAHIKSQISIDDDSFVWSKFPQTIDADFFVQNYTQSALKKAGLYKNITYNGNITLDFLPTIKRQNALEDFYRGKSPIGAEKDMCIEVLGKVLQL